MVGAQGVQILEDEPDLTGQHVLLKRLQGAAAETSPDVDWIEQQELEVSEALRPARPTCEEVA